MLTFILWFVAICTIIRVAVWLPECHRVVGLVGWAVASGLMGGIVHTLH